MSILGNYDHEIKVGSTTTRLKLLKDEQGKSMYQVIEEPPPYQKDIQWVQRNWIDGHGQFDIKTHYSDSGRAIYEGVYPDAYFEGQSIDTTQEGKLILAPLITTVLESDASDLDSDVVCFQWFETTSELLCATSGKIYRYNVGADGEWTAATTAVAGVLGLTEYNGVMYAACGATSAYYYSTDGDTWTATDLADHHSYGFFVAPNPAGTDSVLWKWRSTNKNEISSTTNGKTAGAGGVAWESPTYVGDTTDNITSIFLANDQLMVGREDGLYNVDTNGGVHSLMSDLRVSKSSNNFKYVTQWQSAVYFSLGTGLGEISGYNSYEPMGALTNIEGIGRAGSTVGLTSDKDYLYQAIDEGTDTVIYKGREVRKNGSLIWQWCPWVYLGTNACQSIQIIQHSDTSRRLWFGYGHATAYVTVTDNPLVDTAARFCASGWCRMSYHYGSNPNWDKMVQSIITETLCGGTLTNGGGTFTGSPITLVAGVNTITCTGLGTATVVLPAGTTGTATSGGTCLIAGSVLTLPSGSTTITAGGGVGTFTITLATTSVTPYYRKNSDVSATALTAAITTSGVNRTYLTSELAFKRIQIELRLATDSSTATPVVTYFELRGTEKPETVRTHECVYSVGDRPFRRGEDIRTILRGARTSTTLIRFGDLRFKDTTADAGGYVWVVVEPGFPQEVEVFHGKESQPELGLKIKWREVTFTIT